MTKRTGGAGLWGVPEYAQGDGGFVAGFQMVQSPQSTEVTFGTVSATSSEVDLRGYGPRGLAVAVGTAWTAANIEFDVSPDASTWYPLRDKTGGTVAITGIGTVAAGVYAGPPECWMVGAFTHLRLRSVSGGTAFVQAAARTVTIAFLA